MALTETNIYKFQEYKVLIKNIYHSSASLKVETFPKNLCVYGILSKKKMYTKHMKKRENPSKYIQMSYQTTNCLVYYRTIY